MKIIFVSDFFLNDIIGGGEICDDCVIRYLQKNNKIEKINCSDLTIKKLIKLKDNLFIISNFVLLSGEALEYITDNINYIIYESSS